MGAAAPSFFAIVVFHTNGGMPSTIGSKAFFRREDQASIAWDIVDISP